MKKYTNLFCLFLIVIFIGCETKEEVFTPEFKENIKLRVKNVRSCKRDVKTLELNRNS